MTSRRHIAVDPVYGCWLWTGDLDRNGYGVMWTKAGPRQAHRQIWIEEVGDVPPGKVLDHACKRRNCVRPAHLEPVSGSENDLRRGRSGYAYRVRKSKCQRGHPMEMCILTPEGGRLCRTCQGPEKT